MTAKVILNPYAGRWKALEKRGEAEQALQSEGIDYEITITENPGHGTELARKAVMDGYDQIVVAGGDGSISEVVNGMVLGAAQIGSGIPPLGVLPLGSANDFVVNLRLPKDLLSAARVIAKGKFRAIDLGSVTYDDSPETTRYFDNNSAVGLEPSITLIQQDITWLRGVVRYLVATLIGIARNPQWTMRIRWEGGGEYNGPVTLVTVGNNPLTGGLFYMTPHADPFDGRLTFVYGSMPTRLQILRLLPRTMKPGLGSYVEHPSIHEVHTSCLHIEAKMTTPLHADGEIQSRAATTIEYRVLPGILPVFMDS